jgi:hypothetical protein
VVKPPGRLEVLDADGVFPPDEQDTAATVLIMTTAISDGVRQFITGQGVAASGVRGVSAR